VSKSAAPFHLKNEHRELRRYRISSNLNATISLSREIFKYLAYQCSPARRATHCLSVDAIYMLGSWCRDDWIPLNTFYNSILRAMLPVSNSNLESMSTYLILIQRLRKYARINIIILRIMQQPFRQPLPPPFPKIPRHSLWLFLRIQIVRKLQTRNLLITPCYSGIKPVSKHISTTTHSTLFSPAQSSTDFLAEQVAFAGPVAV